MIIIFQVANFARKRWQISSTYGYFRGVSKYYLFTTGSHPCSCTDCITLPMAVEARFQHTIKAWSSAERILKTLRTTLLSTQITVNNVCPQPRI